MVFSLCFDLPQSFHFSATYLEVCSLGAGSLPVRQVLEPPDPYRQALELRATLRHSEIDAQLKHTETCAKDCQKCVQSIQIYSDLRHQMAVTNMARLKA